LCRLSLESKYNSKFDAKWLLVVVIYTAIAK